MKRVHIIISGYVQGVCFRYFTKVKARNLGLKGFVRNIPNGNVEVIAEGNEKELDELVEFCRKGPVLSCVANLKVEYEEFKGEFNDFTVKF
ncbi:acylphosphatase [Candidatus Woesearchaeota archaeon CG_4_10_14_0_2_um_filter_33_10]|nr:MAG: acylphosphatase [Candidatus Woesearchaeota archaeon CG1_02_33_12]PIN78309.1 MAG: acylphosphatase [Candidatus Woesearchaeota archaeon CG10_big_fil_rev_8_21_14_0_10_33_12]PIU72490.1 MAG: acylphosphatase [Candidatus Woesearchaeota archaeon CG06_land_8_20_14_3_00_33_13]PIZ51945.1 MAG: acylphosphatase [Candidatus Woesearchaeota archaeon CG_4_10_14_0_2_um_filter_33_10]